MLVAVIWVAVVPAGSASAETAWHVNETDSVFAAFSTMKTWWAVAPVPSCFAVSLQGFAAQWSSWAANQASLIVSAGGVSPVRTVFPVVYVPVRACAGLIRELQPALAVTPVTDTFLAVSVTSRLGSVPM